MNRHVTQQLLNSLKPVCLTVIASELSQQLSNAVSIHVVHFRLLVFIPKSGTISIQSLNNETIFCCEQHKLLGAD